eukprot:5328906-Pleurochrysis_carterae.AAC.1
MRRPAGQLGGESTQQGSSDCCALNPATCQELDWETQARTALFRLGCDVTAPTTKHRAAMRCGAEHNATA